MSPTNIIQIEDKQHIRNKLKIIYLNLKTQITQSNFPQICDIQSLKKERNMCERERMSQRNVGKKEVEKCGKERGREILVRKRQRNVRKKEVEKYEKERGREM